MSLVNKFYNAPLPAILTGLGILCVSSIVAAVYFEGEIQEEYDTHQCVQTQEMRVRSTLNSGISSNGSLVLVSGQKIEFKYTCNDHPRWK